MNVTPEIQKFRYLLAVTVSEIQHGSCCLDGVSQYASMNAKSWNMPRWEYEAAFNR